MEPASRNPRRPGNEEQQEALFRTELAHLINADHPLVKLALVVNWTRLHEVLLVRMAQDTGIVLRQRATRAAASAC